MSAVVVKLTSEQIKEIGAPMMDAINEAQMDGFNIDEVLVGLMVILGSAIQQRGAALHLDKPLREALPAIALGYEEFTYDAIALNDPKAQAFRAAIKRAKG